MSPDSPFPSRQRRAWRVMSAAGCLLGAAALLITAVKWTSTDDRQDRQAFAIEQAVCSVISYAEQQSYRLARSPTAAPGASRELEDLAYRMRRAGVHCPPRAAPPSVTPTPRLHRPPSP